MNKKEEARHILLSLSPDDSDNTVSEDETQTQKEYLDSIADALSQEGIEFQRDVGIGGYSIDFALKKEGRFVLGLECDSHLLRDRTLQETAITTGRSILSQGDGSCSGCGQAHGGKTATRKCRRFPTSMTASS